MNKYPPLLAITERLYVIIMASNLLTSSLCLTEKHHQSSVLVRKTRFIDAMRHIVDVKRSLSIQNCHLRTTQIRFDTIRFSDLRAFKLERGYFEFLSKLLFGSREACVMDGEPHYVDKQK